MPGGSEKMSHIAKLLAAGWFNPLTTNVPHHIETSQLICNPDQLTGFYVMGNIGR